MMYTPISTYVKANTKNSLQIHYSMSNPLAFPNRQWQDLEEHGDGGQGLTVLEYHKLKGSRALGGAGTGCCGPGKPKQDHLVCCL